MIKIPISELKTFLGRASSIKAETLMPISSISDDQLLDTFKTLAENINTQELTQQLKELLKKYPQLCNNLALQL